MHRIVRLLALGGRRPSLPSLSPPGGQVELPLPQAAGAQASVSDPYPQAAIEGQLRLWCILGLHTIISSTRPIAQNISVPARGNSSRFLLFLWPNRNATDQSSVRAAGFNMREDVGARQSAERDEDFIGVVLTQPWLCYLSIALHKIDHLAHAENKFTPSNGTTQCTPQSVGLQQQSQHHQMSLGIRKRQLLTNDQSVPPLSRN
ncbi:hypothetical protein BDV95DRAFT_43727 [Massariosphaeria phaeospora]|uniref:Uncharacterized protein n=1 Tax=Massariosphaeria phaeospora TaxID=100035 RepID=A0A7C8I5V0_9PLEO|nr:hypothetical protein BDV95DRAFT_43727 [Massariosphaeria phaeospora]